MTLENNIEEIRLARAGLTQVIEPGDAVAHWMVLQWGAPRVLDLIQHCGHPTATEWQSLMSSGDPSIVAIAKGRWGEALKRWQGRLSYLNPEKALEAIYKLSGGFIIPEDTNWPTAVNQLYGTTPLGLWYRGNPVIPAAENLVSIVGSREATRYGQKVTDQFMQWLAEAGKAVVSGGAYGIDAQAHRSALDRFGQGTEMATGPSTIAIMAGGLDQYYPPGNAQLLKEVQETGSILSELPVGMRPNRYRFLHRNRLIAGLSCATIVIEARWRSGAQNTVGHALELGREVGVVPGPIDSSSSAGCHRLLRESPAQLVFDKASLLELLPAGSKDRSPTKVLTEFERRTRNHDGLTEEQLLIFEALPLKTGTSVDKLCRITGLAVGKTIGILQHLSNRNIAVEVVSGWRKNV